VNLNKTFVRIGLANPD